MERNGQFDSDDEWCDFPQELLDERNELRTDQMLQYKEALEHSPRTQGYLERFELLAGEKLIKTYTWALHAKILLQGRIYITNKRICFYSILNDKTLIFGKATKQTFLYEDIDEIEKCKTAWIFNNAIQFTLKDGKVVRFASLLKRTKAYNIIKNLMEKNDDWLLLLNKESDSSVPEVKHDSPSEMEVDLHEETPKRDATQSFRLNSDFIEKLSELTLENEVFLIGMEEEFKSENLADYTLIHEDKFKNIDLKSFYKRIYGDYVYQNGETFLYNLLDKSENTNINIEENEPEIPSYFANTHKKTGHYEFDSLVDIFSEVRSSVSMVSYTHPINQPLWPPTCQVKETHTSFFVSPSKIFILK